MLEHVKGDEIIPLWPYWFFYMKLFNIISVMVELTTLYKLMPNTWYVYDFFLQSHLSNKTTILQSNTVTNLSSNIIDECH